MRTQNGFGLNINFKSYKTRVVPSKLYKELFPIQNSIFPSKLYCKGQIFLNKLSLQNFSLMYTFSGSQWMMDSMKMKKLAVIKTNMGFRNEEESQEDYKGKSQNDGETPGLGSTSSLEVKKKRTLRGIFQWKKIRRQGRNNLFIWPYWREF